VSMPFRLTPVPKKPPTTPVPKKTSRVGAARAGSTWRPARRPHESAADPTKAERCVHGPLSGRPGARGSTARVADFSAAISASSASWPWPTVVPPNGISKAHGHPSYST